MAILFNPFYTGTYLEIIHVCLISHAATVYSQIVVMGISVVFIIPYRISA